jgi:thiamine monophosphate kinase
MSEQDFLRRLTERLPAVGDDCAVLDGGRLVCTDLLVDDVHFGRRGPRPRTWGGRRWP